MPRPCSTCRHENRRAIELELLSGTPRHRVARKFGLSEPAVRRHFRLHLPALLAHADEATRRELAMEVAAAARQALSDVRWVAERARDQRRGRAMLQAWRVHVPLLDVLSRLRGVPAPR